MLLVRLAQCRATPGRAGGAGWRDLAGRGRGRGQGRGAAFRHQRRRLACFATALVPTQQPNLSPVELQTATATGLVSSLRTQLQHADADTDADTAVVLLTPRLAQWATPSSPLLHQLVALLRAADGADGADGVETGALAAAVHAVVAVVDQIPSPSPSPEQAASAAGHEDGVSVCLTRSANVGLEAVPPRSVANITPRAGQQSEAAADGAGQLFVSLPTRRVNASTPPARQQVGLQLANTLFVNGQPHTLRAFQWRQHKLPWRQSLLAADNAAQAGLTLLGQVQLQTCRLSLSQPVFSASLHLALDPVTAPRAIAGIYGNILSKLHRSAVGGGEETEPASLELERIIPDLVAARSKPRGQQQPQPQSISVWAVIRPRHMDPGLAIDAALQSGARLHRVVSGGGGWGNKQGLLSLDPAVCAGPGSASGHADGLATLREGLAGGTATADGTEHAGASAAVFDGFPRLPEVASEGETIQFYVSADPLAPHRSQVQDRPSRPSAPTRAPRLVFATMPQSTDATVTATGQPSSQSPSPSPASSSAAASRIVPAFFGAATEQRLSLHTEGVADNESGEDAASQSRLCHTMLNAPLTRVVYDQC